MVYKYVTHMPSKSERLAAETDAAAAAFNAANPGPRKRGATNYRKRRAAATAPGGEFMNSFPMDSQQESNLLNSERSREIEMKTGAEVREEMAEDAAEAGVVPGGDGDGNVLIVRVGGRQYSSLADIN